MGVRRVCVLATVALALGATGAFSSVASAGSSCTPAQNIEAIIDDSGSMLGTDINKLRAQGMKLLISNPNNDKKTLGAVEFGDEVATVFAPGLIGPNAAGMITAIDTLTQGDNGTTDYNIAFDKAKADNPGADGRIFLTDGGHNVGDYLNGHVGGPRTYVIGLGAYFAPEDEARMQAIANDTGGKFIKVATDSELQAAVNEVDAYLNCQSPPVKFNDTFTKQGQTKSHSTSISRSIKSVDLALTWADPNNTFVITAIKLKTKSGTIANISARKRLKIKRRNGTTYYAVNIRKLKRGKLIFKIKLTKKGSVEPAVTSITQATRNR